MKTATDIRKEAREALTGKWGKAVAISLIYALVTFIMNKISSYFDGNLLGSILSIVFAIIEVPLGFGLMISFIKLKRSEEVEVIDFLKDGFSNFKRAWGVSLNVLLKMIVPIILMIVVTVLCIVSLGGAIFFSNQAITSDGNLALLQTGSAGVLFLFVVLYIACGIYATIKGLLYYVANYIAYDNPEMTTKEAVEKSAELMKGKRGDLFLLTLSFIGWAILSVCSLGIGFLWLVPYVNVAMVCFYENLINKTEE